MRGNLQQFPEPMCLFIVNTKDVQSDGNWRYGVIADILSLARMDGLKLDVTCLQSAFPHLYESVYEGFKRLEEIRHVLNHFDSGASYAKWMVMHDM